MIKNCYVVCYNRLHVYKNKKQAINDFTKYCYYCDPMSCEYQRYANVVLELQYNFIGRDGVDNNVWEICYEDTKQVDKISTKNYVDVIRDIELYKL